MRMLQGEGYHCISLDDLIDGWERGRPLPPKPIVITFDDGYRDLKRYAFPVLRRLGLVATVFLVSALAGKSNRWDNHLSGPLVPLLSWEDIRCAQGEGICFGSHTSTHRHLVELESDEAREEIMRSKRTIEEKLGNPVDFFSYPYGYFDARIKRWVEESGYRAACTTNGGKNPLDCDRYALRRIMVTGYDSLRTFAFKLITGYGPPISIQAKIDRLLRLRQPIESRFAALQKNKDEGSQ